MAGPQEKKAVAIEVESNDKKKKGKKKGKKGKKAKEAVVELSEEDEAMKNALELAVRPALKTLRDTIKSATSAMTSVPKPLKFLAPHYRNLVSYFDEKLVTQSANKTELADILALVAMSMSNGKKYNRDRAWGDEFVRNLAGELGQEYGERTSSEPPVDTADLLVLVDEVLTFNMNHNAEADSVDMLMEVQQLCNYLMRCAKYESDPDERQNVYKTSFELFMKHKKASDALRCAIKMNNDELVKRQLCFILGRQRAFTFQLDEDEDDDASERLATTLDVQDAKTPEEVYKSHLGDSGRTGLNADGAANVWLYKNKDRGMHSAAASLGMVYQWDVDEGFGALDRFLYVDNINIKAGAVLGIDDTKLSSDGNSLLKVSALLAFGLSYVGTCREEVQDLVEPFIEDVATSLIERLLSASDAELDTPGARFLCLAVGLVFLGREEAADATLEVFKTIENKIGHFAILTVKTCAYAGSGNVLKVQEMLHVCAEHLDEKNAAYHQMVATLGVALLSVGEEVGSAMAMRTMEHLLQYGELPVKRAVPLAIALLHVSDPDFSVVDTVSKLSHDSDDAVAQNAILALGIISAGTNNSRVAGLVTLNPAHSGGLLASNASLAGLLVVLFAAFDQKNTLLDKMHYLLYSLCTACVPRMLVRVGESVDVVGQAGNPRAITGFQTFDTPVLMSTGDRAELVGEEYEPLTSVIEGFVILRKKKNKNTDGESKE
eukprot:GSMAST32.ASY1.ANO1.214.1 assembled CDS